MAQELCSPLPGGVISMTGDAAVRLVGAGSGDGALLYLCLLLRGSDLAGARRALNWTEERLLAARAVLISLGLLHPETQAQEPSARPEPEEPPEYTAADIAQELGKGGDFSALVDETQRRLGKVLSATDLRILYTVYDYLALPAEVILLLVTWCVLRTEEKYGQGRKPTLPQIRSEAFRWKRRGADTPEAAEEYLRKTAQLRSRGARLLPLLGVAGRGPVEAELKYLEAWADMGFEDEAVRLAYERTVLKKQAMNWPYMNSILKSWHQKGLHTVSQIRQEDSAFRREAAPGRPADAARSAQPGGNDRQAMDDIRWMREFLAREKQDGGEER